MELLLFKTEDQLIEEGIARLEKTALNVNGSSGKICRLYLNIINSILGGDDGIYEALKTNHVRAFLSTADTDALDSLGTLLNCGRIVGETDSDYRYRISQQTLSAATSNETAVRLAALSVDGVQQVVMKKFAYGTGSYSVYVVSEYAVTSDDVLANVQAAIEKTNGYGIRFDVLSPYIIDVETNILISFAAGTTDATKSIVLSEAKSKLIEYINSRSMGETLTTKGITTLLTGLSTAISAVTIYSLRIDDKQVFVTDQQCRWNQRFLVSSSPNAITIQVV